MGLSGNCSHKKYLDKFTNPKRLVFVKIFLFCSLVIKITYFPTAPFSSTTYSKA